MMDPLSISASIVGLLTAAGKLTSLLVGFAKSANGAPELAQSVVADLCEFSATLEHLRKFLLESAAVPKSRASLVLVDHVVVILMGCVLTVSELEDAVNSVGTDQWGVLNRVKWALKESNISQIFQRLQAHKSSLSLMLNILECNSNREAERSLNRICGLVEELLECNKEMSRRLKDLELAHGNQTATVAPSCNAVDAATVTSRREREGWDIDIERRRQSYYQPVFESILHTSRVYRRALCNSSMTSLPDSVTRTASWSVLSGLSLADVSNISVLALPIYASEISNSHWYSFGGGNNEIDYLSSSESEDLQRFVKRTDHDHSLLSFGKELGISKHTVNICVTVSAGDAYHEKIQCGHVPIVVAWYGWILKRHALTVPGIFRIKGSPERIRHLPKYDWEIYGNFTTRIDYDVHDAATVLIQYLNRLPGSIIPWHMFERFLLPLRDYPMPSVRQPREIEALRKVYLHRIYELNRMDRSLLLYILDLVGKFLNSSSVNQTSAADLAVIFRRCLLSYPDCPEDSILSQKVLVFLIENQAYFQISHPAEWSGTNERSIPLSF